MMINKLADTVVTIAAIIALVPTLFAGDEKSGFSLYCGSDPLILKEIAQAATRGSVVVIDTRALSLGDMELLATAVRAKKGNVLAYLSIGELHSSQKDAFMKTAEEGFDFESMAVNKNQVFDFIRVDAQSATWKKWVHMEAFKLLSSPGIGGLFLDTVDMIDVYAGKREWKLPRREKSIDAMIQLIRSLKHNHSEKYIFQNGGLNLIGETVFVGNDTGIDIPGMALQKEHPDNPDGLLWENAFQGTDPWTMGRLADLKEIQQAGFTKVFALGYQTACPKPVRFFEKCRAEKFTGASSTSSELLHEVLAFGFTEAQ